MVLNKRTIQTLLKLKLIELRMNDTIREELTVDTFVISALSEVTCQHRPLFWGKHLRCVAWTWVVAKMKSCSCREANLCRSVSNQANSLTDKSLTLVKNMLHVLSLNSNTGRSKLSRWRSVVMQHVERVSLLHGFPCLGLQFISTPQQQLTSNWRAL